MADPLTIAGTAFTVISGLAEGAAANAQAKAQARIYDMQAEQAEQIAARNADIIKQRAEYDAERLERQALKERAMSSRAAIEAKREKDLTQSRAMAVAGASGGGVYDPTVENIYANIGEEGTYNMMSEIFFGESAAANLSSQAALSLYEGDIAAENELFQGRSTAGIYRYQGDVSRFQGRQARNQSYMSALTNVGMTGFSLYNKYAPRAGSAYQPGQYATYNPSVQTPPRNPYY